MKYFNGDRYSLAIGRSLRNKQQKKTPLNKGNNQGGFYRENVLEMVLTLLCVPSLQKILKSFKVKSNIYF